MTTNYITDKLKSSIDKIKIENKKFDNFIETKTNDIMKYFDTLFENKKFKIYEELKESHDYILLNKQPNKFTEEPLGFASSPEILKILNEKMEFELLFENKKIKVSFFHDSKDNIVVLNKNINKIMTRLYNLLLLYKNKKYNSNNKNLSLIDFNFVFYLYSNPRRSNGDKSGKKYLEDIAENPKKCFNVYSGQTIPENNTIYTSRLEECIGLLTHEALHGAGLIYMPYHNSSSCNKGFNIFEMFTNAFASIIHAYLFSFETNTNIKENLMCELYHAILHSARISMNTNITIFDVIESKNNANWTQNALLYEYINGRLLILLFFDLIFSDKKTKEITSNLLSLISGWDMNNKKYSDKAKYIANNIQNINYLKKNRQSGTLKFIKDIHAIFYNNIKKYSSQDKNENLIQQYFLFDPIEIEEKHKIQTLYGGKINYKQKYIEILNLIKNKK
jgi:hypothetical protein